MRTVAVIPGDGIGPEVVESTIRVIEEAGVRLDWKRLIAGAEAARTGEALPASVLEAVRLARVALKGPTATPISGGHRSVNVELRRKLDLYANVRPIRSLLATERARRKFDRSDLVVIRENTEDLYVGVESEVARGVTIATKVVTEAASMRIARFGFEYARTHKRRQVTVAHKANILKVTDGLFLRMCRQVAADYPDVSYQEVLIDNLCAQLVLDPTRFDVLLMGNLYGDIVADLCTGFIGGLGVAAGVNLGSDLAVFEAVHGTAPDIAGKGIANPIAMILTGVLMLDHIGEVRAAERIRCAVGHMLRTESSLTPDLGGSATTGEFIQQLILNLRTSL